MESKSCQSHRDGTILTVPVRPKSPTEIGPKKNPNHVLILNDRSNERNNLITYRKTATYQTVADIDFHIHRPLC